MNAAPQQSIGRYDVLSELGKGSQGTVFLAHDPQLERNVAIKLLDTGIEEFRIEPGQVPLEGKIAGRLTHPNIIPVFDVGAVDGATYLVFEYVKGSTLREWLNDKGPMSIKQAVPLIATVLDAVAAAHEAQVVHLDLNPRNVLVTPDGVPRIMDFGLSQYVDHTPRDSTVATGTLRYMAPEHFTGEPLGPATDVFALGSTFYELVTGKRAMNGSTVVQIMRRIRQESPDYGALRIHPEGDAFVRFLKGALNKDIGGRYADGRAMREALQLFIDDAGLGEQAAAIGQQHSTIEFLLRRMQRKKDFPGVSRTLADINRLTGGDSDASAEKLTTVVLRDFALTNKLLKLVNSAFYGSRAVEVTSVSQAIVILGIEKLRMTANSLTLFGHLAGSGSTAELKDSMTKSFLAGLIARHLAQQARLPAAEEAFICGMLRNLGENLVIYYFSEEFEEICEHARDRGLNRDNAARGVLGVSYSDLGAAVARSWQMPRLIVTTMRPLPDGPVPKADDDESRLWQSVEFANELCALAGDDDASTRDLALELLVERFADAVKTDTDYCVRLLAAGLEKLKQHASIFEIDVPKSAYCRSVERWLATAAVARTA